MPRLISASIVGVLGVLALGSATARAHVALVEPPARYDSNVYIKEYPCGHADNPAGESTRTYVEGSTITVTWDEYIPHPGHFRIALSTEGDQALIDPTDYDDFYVAANVLMDDIADPDGVYDHSLEITLPAGVTCDKCTLQLLQIMTDKMPWGPAGGNELYYQCADITITPAGAGTGSGGEESSDGGEVGEETTGAAGTDEGPEPTATASATGTDDESTGGGGTTIGSTSDASVGGGNDDDDDSGCGCQTDGPRGALGWGAGVLLLGALRRRRG